LCGRILKRVKNNTLPITNQISFWTNGPAKLYRYAQINPD
jgi:hypothetical protein